MKIYLPIYDNGESWSDHSESVSDVAFLTKEKAIEWIKSRGYTKEERNIFEIDKSKKISSEYVLSDEESESGDFWEEHFDYYDDSFYRIFEIEVEE